MQTQAEGFPLLRDFAKLYYGNSNLSVVSSVGFTRLSRTDEGKFMVSFLSTASRKFSLD